MNTFYKKYIPYLFLAPALVFLFVFFFLPFVQVVIMSLKDYSHDIYNPVFTGFDNYIKLFKLHEFQRAVFNTFLFLFAAVPVLTVLPLIAAVFINQKIKGASIYKILIYLPVIVSMAAAAIAFKWLYAHDGILNYILSVFGVNAIGWLTDTRFSLISAALVTIYTGIGYYMIIYLSALMSVPEELYDAAETDGAGAFMKHLTVTVPHIMPVIALVLTMSSISALKVFTEIYIMTKGGPLNSSKTMVYYIYERAFENLDLSMASAASVSLLVIILVFSIVNLYFFEKKRYKL